GGGSVLGRPFNLHGPKIALTIVDSGGDNPEANRAAAEKLLKEVRPFAALSDAKQETKRICPILASAKVFNIGVWDASFDLTERTNNFCSSMVSFRESAEASKNYIAQRMDKTQYTRAGAPAKRRYGIVYSEYSDLAASGPKIVKQFKDAGLDVAASAAVSGDFETGTQQGANVVAQFRNAGVNTVVSPESLALVGFTHAAKSQAYFPEYYIWPGAQDAAAVARLYEPQQWAGAIGLTNGDPDLSGDF